MSQLIKVKIDEAEIWMEAEVDIFHEGKPQRVSKDALKKTVISFEKMSETIKTYCTSLVNTFKEIKSDHAPDKLIAEFGLKISGEGNIYVVKSTAEASLKITAEWEIK